MLETPWRRQRTALIFLIVLVHKCFSLTPASIDSSASVSEPSEAAPLLGGSHSALPAEPYVSSAALNMAWVLGLVILISVAAALAAAAPSNALWVSELAGLIRRKASPNGASAALLGRPSASDASRRFENAFGSSQSANHNLVKNMCANAKEQKADSIAASGSSASTPSSLDGSFKPSRAGKSGRSKWSLWGTDKGTMEEQVPILSDAKRISTPVYSEKCVHILV